MNMTPPSSQAGLQSLPTPAALTFCIPTYNRAASVHRLVSSILSCPDRDIDIVVLDNGSPDDTLKVLHAIADARLTVLSNGTNRGALFNMINVLNKGQGDFVVYCTDQDYIDPSLIADFKSFLRSTPDIAGGFCNFNGGGDADNVVFARGFDSVQAIAYTGRHPTGYFFRNAFLKSIDVVNRFADFEIVDLFPLEFAFAEIGMLGRGAIYQKRLFSPETGASVVSHKSSTTQGSSKQAFFAPAARLKLAISYSRHLQTLRLLPGDRARIASRVFISELMAATVGYRAILGNAALCIHYRMAQRVVSRSEMVRTGLSFCGGYARAVYRANLAGMLAFASRVALTLCRKVATRIGSKLTGRAAA